MTNTSYPCCPLTPCYSMISVSPVNLPRLPLPPGMPNMHQATTAMMQAHPLHSPVLHDLTHQASLILPVKLTCLCRPAQPAQASSEGAAAELQRLRQEAAELQQQNAQLRCALQEACMSALPPEAAQYVQV